MQTSLVRQFWQEEDGATAIEYGLIAGLVAVAIIVALTTMSTSIQNLFTRIATALDGTAKAPAAGDAGGGG